MKIKGFEKVSLVDYPEHVACTIFLAGCNLRCHYCYNHKLVLNTHELPDIEENEIFKYIQERASLLEGICISGGEPTVHKNLPEFIKKIRTYGLPIKLDTNGTNSEMVAYLIKNKMIDYLALDIKAPLNCKYITLTHIKPDLLSTIKKTIQIVAASSMQFELRTTVIPSVHDSSSFRIMREQIENVIGKYKHSQLRWFVQPFIPRDCMDPNFNNFPQAKQNDLQNAMVELQKTFPNSAIRY